MLSIADDTIVFRTRGAKTCSLTPEDLIRRFFLHVLPQVVIRITMIRSSRVAKRIEGHYGRLAPSNVNTRLVRAQQLLGPVPATTELVDAVHTADDTIASAEPGTDPINADNEPRPIDRSAPRCPHCNGRLVPLTPRRSHRFQQRAPPNA